MSCVFLSHFKSYIIWYQSYSVSADPCSFHFSFDKDAYHYLSLKYVSNGYYSWKSKLFDRRIWGSRDLNNILRNLCDNYSHPSVYFSFFNSYTHFFIIFLTLRNTSLPMSSSIRIYVWSSSSSESSLTTPSQLYFTFVSSWLTTSLIWLVFDPVLFQTSCLLSSTVLTQRVEWHVFGFVNLPANQLH